jgi:hypothetical protein
VPKSNLSKMNSNNTNNTSDETMKTLSYVAIIIFVIWGLRECSNKNIKARAFEKMEENRSMSAEEAYEEAEYEHDESIDAMNESY